MVFSNLFVASIKVNRKILREYNNEVLLPFGAEYSILLKNLNSKRANVKISIDGRDVLNGRSLIINGNTTSEIERFVNDLNQGNRFKFIEKTEQISKHRGDKIDDGIVRVEYQFEEQPYSYLVYYPPVYYPPNYIMCSYTDCNVRNVEDVSFSDNPIIMSNTCDCNCNDQGITVEGDMSNQKFSNGYIGNLEPNSYVITIKLKGKTNKKIETPITTKTKFVCNTCGKKSKSLDKFCGRCGTSLIVV